MAAKRRAARASEYEAELVGGLESVALAELREKLGGGLQAARKTRDGFLRFRCDGPADRLADLGTVIALYRVHDFAIPRPKALLGHQHFSRLLAILRQQLTAFTSPARSFGVGAAGADSSVMRRLRRELAQALDLEAAADGKGELFMRLARSADGSGWEILLRTTPRPLSKRAYRLRDAPGALNATVAHAMARMSRHAGDATVVNLCSGTNTILIEQALLHRRGLLIAIDHSPDMIVAGRINAAASETGARIRHLLAEAQATPLPAACADLLYADLPWGSLVGSHADNERLYPAVLREAARIAKPDARFLLLTHELRLTRRCLRRSSWRAESEMPLALSGLRPRLFVLRRNLNTI